MTNFKPHGQKCLELDTQKIKFSFTHTTKLMNEFVILST